MAEFALGLTKTAVEGTLSLVKSAIEEEKKLRDKVQNDLVFITGEFEVMQSFLQDASREHARNNKVTLTLVRQLRTMAFDVEDCVEYVIHLDLDKSSIWGGLRRLWQTVNCRAPPLPLDVAVAEIKQLKARMEDVSHRSTRYNLILHGSDDNGDKQQQQQPVTVMPLSAEEPPYATTTTATYPSSTAFHALRDAWKATGKWSSNICNLQQELLKVGHHDLHVISVWGSNNTGGGAGAGPRTASILTKAYCDPEICENFKIRAWVKLTHPFNHDEFVKSLLAQLYASSSHQTNNAGVDFMQQMREQRYLLVLEDVLAVAEWDVIRKYLPDNKNGSRVLLSTPKLGIALLCIEEPYKVSGDNEFLCVFSQKKTSSDIGKFYRHLLRGHGVISVWGPDDDEKSNLMDILYRGIINRWLEEIGGLVADKSDHVGMLYEGIRNRGKFEQWHSSWVDVPDPFDLKVFAQRLFLNFHSDDIRAKEITEVGKKGEAGLIEWCRMFLSEVKGHDPYVVVINGLRSERDWELIQSTFFSSKATLAKAGCIFVITKEETVAKYCVKDHTHLAFNAKDLKADPSISALIEKGCWYYAIRGKKGRLFYDRKKDTKEWTDKFGGNILDPDEGKDKEGFHVYAVKRDQKGLLEEDGGNSEKGVLRHAYYGALFQQQIERRCCSWVDSPCDVDRPGAAAAGTRHPFLPLNLTDFTWRLLLDFYSDDPQAKERVAVGLMEGTIINPLEKCREFIHNKKCLVVINGRLESTDDWYSIRTFFSKQHNQSIIIVHSFEQYRARIYDATKELPLSTQEQDLIDMEYRRIYSTRKRYQEAIQWFKTHQPVGRQKEVEVSISNDVSFKKLVAVWGISGVGNSTLVRTAYYQDILFSSGLESLYGFGDTKAFAWVDVPSPFNLIDFTWCLLLGLYSDDPHAMESAAVSMVEEGRQVPILECRKILSTGKCLVVMDGLHSKQVWDLIKATFLAEDIEATIVVITNEEEVAMHCVKNAKDAAVINITRLEANVTLRLFEKINQQKGVPDSIVAKCGGLPKVVAAIGEASRYHNDLSSWLEYLNDNFMAILETDPKFHGLRPLFSWMQSYFDACSDSLKPCIFYLSIFSAEKNIRRRRLLCRWIAEGYCRDTSDGTTCEENGEKFISELVKLSIVQQYSPRNKVFCQINGFFHEYIISRPMEDNLVFALEGRCSLNSRRGGQHLTIRSSWDRDEVVYESIDFSRLRSLTVFCKWESFFISNKNMRLLRVLDLEDATDVTNEDLDKIAKLLTRLKFLSLRGHTKINCLPISMGGLRQLQTLDIRDTFIVMLPLFIMKLQKLRYIRAGTTTEIWDWEGDIVVADGEEDRASSSAKEGDIVPAGGTEDRASSSTQECNVLSADGEEKDKPSSSAQADTNLPPPAAAATPTEGGRYDSTASSSAQAVTILPAGAATIEATPTEGGTNSTSAPVVLAPNAGNNRPRALVSSLLSKLCRRSGGGVDNNNGPAAGVTVLADIGKLVVLHILGVIKVNAQCGNKDIFQELKKLTQLRKLGVSGINEGNIKKFCSAVSGHAHLKSLSVELDKDDNLDGLDDLPQLPKTLESLKLYGRVNKLLVWFDRHGSNLKKRTLDLTIEKPEELGALEFVTGPKGGHLRIRPIQGGDLHFRGPGWRSARVVEIQCCSVLHINFDNLVRTWDVEVLRVHFSGGSSLEISGLSELGALKEVWLKGYTNAHKQYMQRQINEMDLKKSNQVRPVLKLVQPCVTNSTSEPEAQADAPEAHTCVDAHSRSRLAGVTCCARAE